MPAKSPKQARLMRAAAHGADFPMARKVRESMSPDEMRKMEHTGKSAPKPSDTESYVYGQNRRGKK